MSIEQFTARVVGATLAAAAAAAVLAAPANAAATWAAISYSPATGAYGYSYEQGSKQQALDVAAGFCVEYGGTDCQMAAVNNVGCLALAYSPDNWHGGLGPTKADAEADALALNGGGDIAVSGCTGA